MLKKASTIAEEIYTKKLSPYFTHKNESCISTSEDFPSNANTTLELNKETIKMISERKRLTRALSEEVSIALSKYNLNTKVLDNGNMQITPVPEVIFL